MKHWMSIFTVCVGSLVLTTMATADDVADIKATAEDAIAAYNAGDADAMGRPIGCQEAPSLVAAERL